MIKHQLPNVQKIVPRREKPAAPIFLGGKRGGRGETLNQKMNFFLPSLVWPVRPELPSGRHKKGEGGKRRKTFVLFFSLPQSQWRIGWKRRLTTNFFSNSLVPAPPSLARQMVSFSTVTAAPIKTGSKDDGLGPLPLESNLKYLLYSPPPLS